MKLAKLRYILVCEWNTGANDEETQEAYNTLDPEKCAEVDRENINLLGPIGFAGFFEDDQVTVARVEVVSE